MIYKGVVYNKSDKIVIRKDLKGGTYYDDLIFNDIMVSNIGKTVTIRANHFETAYNIKEDGFLYNNAMIDHEATRQLSERDVDRCDVEHYNSLDFEFKIVEFVEHYISLGFKFKTVELDDSKKMRYNINNEVVLRYDLEYDNYYDEVHFNKIMARNTGEIVTIESISSQGSYRIEGDAYDYNDAMINHEATEKLNNGGDTISKDIFNTDISHRTQCIEDIQLDKEQFEVEKDHRASSHTIIVIVFIACATILTHIH